MQNSVKPFLVAAGEKMDINRLVSEFVDGI